MIFKSALFVSLLIIAAGRPQAQAPSAGQPAPPPAGPAPGGQDPSHDHPPPATIVKNEFEDDGKGTFRWEFETSDGSKAEQTGHTVNPGTEQEGEVVQGSYSYKSPDGQIISVSYIADQNGFQPKGSHLPTAPSDPNVKSASNSTAAGSPTTATQQQG